MVDVDLTRSFHRFMQTLQERSRLQRAKQIEFLRKQGLINSEADVKGGALDTSSLASSGANLSSP